MEVHELPVEDVIPTPDNKRRIDPKSEDMIELSQSIREKGVLQPVLVRPHPQKQGKFDLRAGHRRLVGSVLAGKETIPAIVREMDDRTAAEVTTIENLQREDLSVIEEAEQLQVMIDAGWDVEACAISIGKTLAWVHSRARVAKLTPAWKKAVGGGREKISTWSPAHLEVVAEYPATTQADILNIFGRSNWTPDLKRLREEIGRITNELGKAPFDPNDADLLPKAGACVPGCSKRRGFHPDLFLEIGAESLPLKNDVCLDPKCFAAKVQARLDRMLVEAQAKDERTVAVEKSWHGFKRPGSTSYVDDYRPAKKTDPGAIPAIVIGGEGRVGQKVWVKPEKSASGAPRTGKKTLAEKREQLKQRRLRHANAAMWELIEKMKLPDKPESWLGQMIAAGAYSHEFPRNHWSATNWGDIFEEGEAVLTLLWEGIVRGLSGLPLFNRDQIGPKDEENLTVLGEELGISWPDLVAAAVEAIPEPKAWQKEAAAAKTAKQNGQAKTAPSKKAKKPARAAVPA